MTRDEAGIWVTDPEAYRNKLAQLLGERDPLDVLSEMPNRLAHIVNTTPANVMRQRPFVGKWAPSEIIGHLSDSEWVYGFRIRQVLCEEEAAILAMDQDRWVAVQNHNDREPLELLEMFTGLRLFNLGIWRRIDPSDLRRSGRHDERGTESLDVMLRMCAGHDLSHLDQLDRYLEAIGQG